MSVGQLCMHLAVAGGVGAMGWGVGRIQGRWCMMGCWWDKHVPWSVLVGGELCLLMTSWHAGQSDCSVDCCRYFHHLWTCRVGENGVKWDTGTEHWYGVVRVQACGVTVILCQQTHHSTPTLSYTCTHVCIQLPSLLSTPFTNWWGQGKSPVLPCPGTVGSSASSMIYSSGCANCRSM